VERQLLNFHFVVKGDTPMLRWTPEELNAIGNAEELHIAPYRRDGTSRQPVPIWVVRVGDDLYIRSWRGQGGRWYRGAQQTHEGHIRAGGIDKDVTFVDAGDDVNDAVDDAYRTKYRSYPTYVPPMIAPEARVTTIKLVPR
jgi:hypothetical protein